MRETKAEKNYVSKVRFRNWVRAMNEQFEGNEQSIVNYIRGVTYVYLRSKVGTARCNPNDTFDGDIGVAYAWARCTGQPVYYEMEEGAFKSGEWVFVDTVNNNTRFLLEYIVKGIDNYCFKENCGRLILINENNIAKISRAD